MASFLWNMNNLDQPMTGHLFSFNRDRWRGGITPQKDLFLQLASSVNTVTVNIRYENCIGKKFHKLKIVIVFFSTLITFTLQD